MHGDGHEAFGAGDRLAPYHLLADLDEWNRRRPAMLGERDDQLGGKREPPNRLVRRQILVLDRVDAVIEGRMTLEDAEKSHA